MRPVDLYRSLFSVSPTYSSATLGGWPSWGMHIPDFASRAVRYVGVRCSV